MSVMTKLLTTGSLLVLLMCSGCASHIFPANGDVAISQARIAITSGKEAKGIVATEDMRLAYGISVDSGKFMFSGDAFISDSIRYSFNAVKSFTVKMSFLDSAGSVLESLDISPHYLSHGTTPEKMHLKKQGAFPAGANAVVFSWYGVFYSTPITETGSWTMSYYPFQQ